MIAAMAAPDRPQKITFGDMRDMGVRGVLIYCADYHCSDSLAISADRWPDELRLSDLEPSVYLLGMRQAWRGRAAGFQLENRATMDGMGYR